MILSSYIQDSFQEFPGYQSLVLFSKGCNLCCPDCYNKGSMDKGSLDALDIINTKLTPFHEGVVFLGGEPTLWADLPDLITQVKQVGLATKLYTNGMNSRMLEQILKSGSLDALSIDLKTLSSQEVIGVKCFSELSNYIDAVKDSLDLAYKAGVPLEVRTTKFKGVNLKEIEDFLKSNYSKVPWIIQDLKIF